MQDSQRGACQIYLNFTQERWQYRWPFQFPLHPASASHLHESIAVFFRECNSSGQLIVTEEEAMPQSDKAVLKKP